MRTNAASPGAISRSSAHAATILGLLERLLAVAGGVLLAVLLAVVLVAVAMRYSGAGGISGSDELATWLYIALIFVGYPLVAGSALAMRFDLISSRLRGYPRDACEIVSHGIVIHASLLLVASGLALIGETGGVSPVLGWPEWWRYGLAPAAGLLGAAIVLLRLVAEGRQPLLIVGSLAVGVALFLFSEQGEIASFAMPSLVAGLAGFVGLLLGAPLPHALLSALSLVVPLGSLLPQTGVLQTAVSGVGSFLLLAIPFFLLAGTLMLAGGLAGRLVALADALVGHRRGGLAQTTLLTNVFFSGISGSSLADAAFGAKVLAPGLVARGYRPELAAAIVASTAVLPNILPPSVAFLMLAVATNLSIGSLFVGGLAGGLFIALVLALALRLVAPETASGVAASGRQRWSALASASPVLGLGVIILLGIRLGVVTTTEASALAAGYALLLAWFYIRRSRGVAAALAGAFTQAAREAAAVGLLIASTAPFTFLLAVDQVPAALDATLQSVSGDPFTFLLVANILLLIVGCPLEIGVAILLFGPLLLPAAVSAGIDPIHFGVIIVVNLMIGSLTPPVGSLVFIAAGIAGLPSGKVFRAVLPLVGALILGLLAMSVAAGLWAIV